jgi:methionyl-tRNA formyltransferase
LKIVFFGSSDFSVPFLEHLYNAKHKITSIVTNKDKISGRGKKIIPNPVKVFALNNGIKHIEVVKLDDDFYKKIIEIDFDCFVIVSFGHIIPKKIIELANDNAINVHPSILPLFRGPSPIISALLEGCQQSGISIMKINENLDEGDIYVQSIFKIGDYENKDMLEEKMIRIGAPLLNSVIELLDNGCMETFPQAGMPSYTHLFKKDDLKIDWSCGSNEIVNKVRAFSQEPGAQSGFRNMKVKILSLRFADNYKDYISIDKSHFSPKKGEIICADKVNGIIISCGNNEAVKLLELKPEGKNKISGHDFLNGYRVKIGEYFY